MAQFEPRFKPFEIRYVHQERPGLWIDDVEIGYTTLAACERRIAGLMRDSTTSMQYRIYDANTGEMIKEFHGSRHERGESRQAPDEDKELRDTVQTILNNPRYQENQYTKMIRAIVKKQHLTDKQRYALKTHIRPYMNTWEIR